MYLAWRRCPGIFRLSGFLFSAAALGLVAGCGGDNPFDMVRVTGEVTYEDGSVIPASTVVVTFYPQADPIDAKTHPKFAVVYASGEDGSFPVVSTHEYGDGLIAGRHKVTVVARDENEQPTGAVPEVYASLDTTPLEVEVTGRSEHLKLKVPKPNGSPN